MHQKGGQALKQRRVNPLQLPELLHVILLEICDKWWYQDDRTIMGCTLVNQLWESETNRLLWELCGEGPVHNHHPAVRHLMAIKKNRRQRYANHIRTLWLRSEEPNGWGRWEGRFHAELTNLSFPALEELSIHSPSWPDEECYLPIKAPVPYSQPRLRRLEIFNFKGRDCTVIGSEFLLALSDQSKTLTELCLYAPSYSITASRLALSGFLGRMNALTRVTLGSEPTESISSDAFFKLSQLPALQQLEIRDVQSGWVKGLESSAFAALHDLNCGIDANELEELLRIIPGLHRLSIRAEAGSTDVFCTVVQARLVQLVELRIDPCPGTRISVQDLFSLADSATGLQILEIPYLSEEDMDFQVRIDDLDDTMLLALAKRLPQLEEFRLLFENSRLTEKSLISLGLQCRALTSCSLSAVIDYKKLVEEVSPGTFANLNQLTVAKPDEDGAEEVELNDLLPLAKALMELMPKLRFFDCPAHWELSSTFDKLLREARTNS